jgi:hypothetical protein
VSNHEWPRRCIVGIDHVPLVDHHLIQRHCRLSARVCNNTYNTYIYNTYNVFFMEYFTPSCPSFHTHAIRYSPKPSVSTSTYIPPYLAVRLIFFISKKRKSTTYREYALETRPPCARRSAGQIGAYRVWHWINIYRSSSRWPPKTKMIRIIGLTEKSVASWPATAAHYSTSLWLAPDACVPVVGLRANTTILWDDQNMCTYFELIFFNDI